MHLSSNPCPSPTTTKCHHPLPATPTPTSILHLLKTTRTLAHLKQLHALAVKTARMGRDPVVAAEVLRRAVSLGGPDLRYARTVFDGMPERNCFAWNTMIHALTECERAGGSREALELFADMLRCPDIAANQYTFPPVLQACAQAGAAGVGKAVHAMVVKMGVDSDGFVVTNLVRMYAMCGFLEDAWGLARTSAWSAESEAGVVMHNVLIDGYFRLGKAEQARKVFDGMLNKCVVSWNGMIAGYAQTGHFREAIDAFQTMQLEGVKPNYVSLVSILPAIARLCAVEMGNWVHLYAKDNNIPVDDVLGSALVDMYSKCGNVDKAIQVFEGLPKKNPITWSAFIAGLAVHGRATDALKCFEELEKAGVAPHDAVFIGILNACSHAGLVKEGRRFFDRMVNVYKVTPKIEHYTCMVDMLGRAGLLGEAEELVNNLPVEPDDVIYKSLLASCKLHGNADIAARVADRLLELAPADGGCYVLLSNIYASTGNWKAMAQVRMLMKQLDIRKDPGCSWITVDGIMHEFVMEDNVHPRRKEIYEMLDKMSAKLQVAGHVPVTSQVLVNVNEEDKASMLLYHSEKIAIAFGLISTSEGTTLQVVKNLRVCRDCHESVKLISKLYNRRIILRDRKRFHHFENGLCSCKDYW